MSSLVDLPNLRQLPGLAHRPSFPEGLQVLLVDADETARAEAEVQLRGMSYAVAPCNSAADAVTYLSSPENSVDVLLIDVRCLQRKCSETSTIVHAARTVPLVLMSDSGAPSEVMLGIKLGAMDFLEKPLSPLKLKNIWQHTVRRLIAVQASGSASSPLHKRLPPLPGTSNGPACICPALPEDSAGASHGSGGESGSNASTGAAVKMDTDIDMMEASSFIDALAISSACAASPAQPQPAGLSAPGSSADLLAPSAGASGGTVSAAKPVASRATYQKYKAPRLSASGSAAASGAAGNGSTCMGKPVLGISAGQLPELPAMPGIVWGLPTNPLQICPKPPTGLLGAMPWLNPMVGPAAALFGGPMMGGPMLMAAAAAATPAASGSGSGMSSVGSMASLNGIQQQMTAAAAAAVAAANTMAPPVPTMPMPMSMSALAPPPMPCSPPPMSLVGSGGAGAGPLCSLADAGCSFRRADSAPLPSLALCGGSAGSFTLPSNALSCTDFLNGPPSGSTTVAPALSMPKLDAEDWFMDLDSDEACLPPIGLSLKNSPSLADLISASLKCGDSIFAC